MRTGAIITLLLLSIPAAPQALADPVFGFTESFTGPSTSGWAGGIATFNNPGTGGQQGAGDGYLFGNQPTAGRWGLRCLNCVEFDGDWMAAGITHLSVWLNDVGADDTFEIHAGIGNNGNFWQYDPGFIPPHNQWQRFIVDFSNPAMWTQIIGSGTFTQALQTADRLLFRHDLAPFVMQPNVTLGDLGIDEITIGDLVTPVHSTSWGRVKSLYR